MDFFTQHNRFTARTGEANDEDRLNKRHTAIIEWNQKWIAGKRILDIGAYDGRWAFAAIKAGASHVTCVEPRESHIDWLHGNMSHYGVNNYKAVCGDIHEEISNFKEGQFDLIFCLGFFYHTIEHGYLFRHFERLRPNSLIFDTHIMLGTQDVIQLKWESSHKGMCAFGYKDKMLVGSPTKSALNLMFQAYGFHEIDYFDWASIKNPPSDYDQKKRVTVRARRKIKVA